MKVIPLHDATVPIACTIEAEEVPERIALIERLRANLATIDRSEHGLVLRFPEGAEIDADVRRFAIDEKRCCQFWQFDAAAANGEITLRWDGPADARELLDHLHRYFTGDEPLTSISGLL